MSSYTFGKLIGFLLIPFVIYLVAVLLAKKYKVAAWILFAVGTVLSVLSLLGQQKSINMWGSVFPELQSLQTSKILLFVVLAVVALVLIAVRAQAGANTASETDEEEQQGDPEV